MSRKRRAEKREINGDPIYNDYWIAKFINCVMLDGKKSIIYRNFYKAVEKVKKELKIADENFVTFFYSMLDKAAPKFELKSRRFGGSNYQIPVPVGDERGKSIAIKVMSRIIKDASGKNLENRFLSEMINIDADTGATIAKKKEIERTAMANKAFADFGKRLVNNNDEKNTNVVIPKIVGPKQKTDEAK
jgi:small subunit ribosomal protein S7